MATASAIGRRTDAPGFEATRDFTTRVFWLFVVGHVIVWTLVPLLTQPNMPLDAIEMLYWGHEWQLGYHKHPPLPAWIAESVAVVTHGRLEMMYLVCQLAVVGCFWSAWRLGREMLSPRLALLGACLLECCAYYNYASTEFNNRMTMYPFWALAILFLYWALETGRNRYWIATGAALGLGLLAKYSTGMLVLTMLLFMFVNGRARRAWTRPGPYLTTLTALLIFSPHLYWAVTHRFCTVDYALARSHSEGRLIDHLLCPLGFAASQLWALLPMIVVTLPLTGFRWRLRKIEPGQRFGRDFLVAMALGPFLLHLVVAAVFGLALRSKWGSQLWPFFGLLMLFCLELKTGRSAWRRVVIGWAVIALALVSATAIRNTAGPYIRGKTSRIHFPGRALAARVHDLWGQRYDEPVPIVAGEWWLAGNAAAYSPDRPSVYGGRAQDSPTMSPRYSQWTSDQDLITRGGVILWDARRDDKFAAVHLPERFPTAELLEPITIPWQTGASVPPLEVGVAVVPPGSQLHARVTDQTSLR